MERLIYIFLLGFSSGLPFLLTLSTLSAWLQESGVTKTFIGFTMGVTITYALKFIWAPIVDKVKIPFLTNILGKRRAWLLCLQLLLMYSIFMLSNTNPSSEILKTAFWAFMVALFSANQDIVIEAYRVEILPFKLLGIGSSASVLGFHIGMLIAGAGSLYLASAFSWNIVYKIMSLLILLGIITTLICPEPKASKIKNKTGFKQWFFDAILTPIQEIHNKSSWYLVIPFIFCFKIGDTILNAMNTPFLLEKGYSKLEIAHVAKSYGLTAMLLGCCIGGILTARLRLSKAILICASLQVVSGLLFVVQAKLGYNIGFLFLTMGFENLVSGISQVCLITYFSAICKNSLNTATTYALLSSISSLDRVLLSVVSGYMAENLGWIGFYMVVAIGCVPAIYIIAKYSEYFDKLCNNR